MADDLLFSKKSQKQLNVLSSTESDNEFRERIRSGNLPLSEYPRLDVASGNELDLLAAKYKLDPRRMGSAEEGNASGTSIFDPVLCELAYRWWCPPGGVILDPFAGGSVRGVVASKLGRHYTGVDLSARQIEANRAQAGRICDADNLPTWHVGDSSNIETIAAGVQADFIFSCPPYADLEVYSEDPRDLSTMSYEQFREIYSKIIAACVRMLKPNRFACFVVGDARGKDGTYYCFPWHTIQAFIDAGAKLYNEAVLLTAIGSMPVRMTKQFDSGKKLGKVHQNVFVFVKGDAKKAADLCTDL